MNREIKFRAWCSLHECMITDYCTLADNQFEGYDLTNNRHNIVAVMQFTGLTDKNGKEIYEGDIVKDSVSTMKVTYNSEIGSFMLNKKGWLYGHYFGEAIDPKECEIIGNIFQNPELAT